MHPGVLIEATRLAVARASHLHAVLIASLRGLEAQVQEARAERLLMLQKQQQLRIVENNAGAVPVPPVAPGLDEGGISRDDPILAWSQLHKPSQPLSMDDLVL